MNCIRTHGNNRDGGPIIAFCTNPHCMIKLACAECILDFHSGHRILRIEEFIPFARQKVAECEVQTDNDQLIKNAEELQKHLFTLMQNKLKKIRQDHTIIPEINNETIITEELINTFMNLNTLQQQVKLPTEDIYTWTSQLEQIIQMCKSQFQLSKVVLRTNETPWNEGRYQGELVNFKRDGDGRYIDDGFSYEGGWKNDLYHGFGKYYWNVYGIMQSYEGQSINGEYDGFGIRKWDGQEYRGSWQQGKMHGWGVLTYQNGSKYIGEFQNDLKEGYGIYYSISGDIYDEVSNNQIARYKWPVCPRYEGFYKQGLRHGQGILYLYNNYKLADFRGEEGEWKHGKQISIHRYYKHDNLQFKSYDNNGKLIETFAAAQ